MKTVLATLALLLLLAEKIDAFVLQKHTLQHLSGKTLSNDVSSSSALSMAVMGAEFELQELRANLEAMKEGGVSSQNLFPEKRQELENYVRAVVEQRASPVPLTDIEKRVPNTTWRLAFSNNAASLGDLPREASVRFEFLNEKELNYVLQFDEKQVKGLKRLVAKSSYEFLKDTANVGAMKYVYNDVKTDVFGLKNLSVGFFGLLKGRGNYVYTVYFDGNTWIDAGLTAGGQEYFNVFVREEDTDPWK